ALYAFCREVDDIVDDPSDPGVARVKLAWWRNEVAAIFGGAPQHPVAQALQQVVAGFALREAQLQAVLDGMTMDLEQQRYADFAMLERYCDLVAGAVGLMSAEIFGYSDPATRGYARDLGIAFQLTNIIRDVGEDARRGRIYLPQDELDRFGVTAADIFAARDTPGFRPLLRFQVARARAVYDRALSALPAVDRRAQRPGLMMAATYRALLKAVEREDFRVLDRRIALSPLRKAWTAWTASWSY
ncbi:MAG: presqualene diphosphate synthase HpnD, partial [Casimicrobiaceae bacterium]